MLGTLFMSLQPVRLAFPLLTILAVATFLLVIGCAAEPTPTPTALPTPIPRPTATPPPTQTPTPEPLVFLPSDEASHDAPIEWWYFNGMLRDDAGGEYGYHFVTFQTEGAPGVVPHLLQATLGDHGGGVHYAAERGALLPEQHEARSVDAETGGWLMRAGPKGYDMRFHFDEGEGPVALELRAVPRRDPVLHGGTGLVHMGAEAGSTYYYSRTRLHVTGWIEDVEGRRPVTGPGWMDHQWGEIASGHIGWDWASVQFDDGADLMVAVVWHPDGRRRLSGHGTYLEPDGTVKYLEGDDVSINGQGSWTSPETGVEYPMGWQVEVGSLELGLELTPYLQQAESASGILGVSYWEGAVSVEGQRNGEPVSGWGFVELVGYDPRQLEVTPSAPTLEP